MKALLIAFRTTNLPNSSKFHDSRSINMFPAALHPRNPTITDRAQILSILRNMIRVVATVKHV